ncbi:MAG TPA: 50S ribosomal protein L24 [Dongiaceae bacterium]|jgi:large subunit ribosomal protein L24|nr:50S ribosomal protein L24 [Dongiaceae bacterium]
MAKFHVKKGDEVVVIAGAHRGKRGKILEVLTDKQRVRIETVALMKKHTRKSQDNPNGAIIEREGSVHVSNVMKAEQFDARAAKRGTAPAAAK